MPEGPEYRGRSPEQIVFDHVYFDSVGYMFRALSWLDITKRTQSVCALQYAAHDARQGIEQLFFEEIVMSVGTAVDRSDYERCRGNATKLYKVLKRLNHDYARLAQFTQAILSVDQRLPPLVTWDHKVLIKYWGNISNYLHWAGEPSETVQCEKWVAKGISDVEDAAMYVWTKNKEGYSGIMMPEYMQPEVRDCWERFRDGEIDIDAVIRIGHIALPVLGKRNTRQMQGPTNG